LLIVRRSQRRAFDVPKNNLIIWATRHLPEITSTLIQQERVRFIAMWGLVHR
jgi:hypothetical protein